MGKILIVDDNTVDRGLWVHWIENGMPQTVVLETSTLGAGLKVMRKHVKEIHLVLLDLTLADCRGVNTVRRFRTEFKDVPVIAITDDRDTPSISEVIEAGADDYMGKPFTEASLIERIEVTMVSSTYASVLNSLQCMKQQVTDALDTKPKTETPVLAVVEGAVRTFKKE